MLFSIIMIILFLGFPMLEELSSEENYEKNLKILGVIEGVLILILFIREV